MNRQTLLVCLKYPAVGCVKTRLAEALGERRAAELYREWIGRVFVQLQPLRGDVLIVGYFSGAPAEAFAEWRQLADEWWPQPDGDLGTRLAAGFAQAHVPCGLVAAIGTDCLEIDAALIGEAFSRLECNEAVFGPTPDGGYYLVGTSRHVPTFFDGVPWSTADTFATHLSLCEARGVSVSVMPQRRDIDTVEDWRACSGNLNSAPLRIAIVVPTLNEEAALADTLDSVRLQSACDLRLIVSDGGSTDATIEVAKRFGAAVFRAPRRGRGCQIAAVIRSLQEEVVLVLHADTRLPAGAVDRIRRHLLDHADCPGGCLGHRFDSRRTAYRLVETVDALRARCGRSYGDQGQFFRRALLARSGGFPDQPIMEDIELSRRMRGLGQLAYLNCPVLASPRRLERLGLWRSAVLNFLLRTAYRFGGAAACDRLYRLYYRRLVRPANFPLSQGTGVEAMKRPLIGSLIAMAIAALATFPFLAYSSELSKDSLDTVLKNVTDEQAVLVDVREKKEWDAGHVEGAIFLPLSALKKGIDAEKLAEILPKDKVLYIHCVVGKRAVTAGDIIEEFEYKVRPIKPGYVELIEAGFKKAED